MKVFGVSITISQNPVGVKGRVLYGLSFILDGFVRVVSLGFVSTNLPEMVQRHNIRKMLGG